MIDPAALFARADGTCRFARCGRPIVPLVSGVADLQRALCTVIRAGYDPDMAMDPGHGLRLAARVGILS